MFTRRRKSRSRRRKTNDYKPPRGTVFSCEFPHKSILTLQRRMPSPTYTNPGIAAVVQDQQLERLNFATGLRQDPAGYSQFQQQNIKAIVDDITNRKQSAFQKAQIDLGRYMDMHHNVNFYKTRSGDVDNITNVILANNQKIEDLITQDKINSRRQFEINEWYNYNKLETLFLLQIVFMASLAAAIVMYLAKKGMITVGLAGVLYGLLGLSVLFTGLYKYFYTEGARDVKLWHRRRFQSTPAPPPPPSCPTGTGAQAVDDAMAAAMALELSAENCGSNINQGLTNITMGAANQLAAMQSGQTNLIQQLSSTGSAALGAVCGSGQ